MNKYSNVELLTFKEKLLKLKAADENQLNDLNENSKTVSENGKDENSVDSTSYSVQIESIIGSKNRVMKHLAQIENALMRIENNRYGICVETGELISKERLLAVPTTTMSIEGKKIREERG